MNKLDTKYETNARIKIIRNWYSTQLERWNNPFALTIRTNQKPSQIDLSPRESAIRDLRFIANRVNSKIFGNNNHKRKNKKSIGLLAAAEYTDKMGWHIHAIVSVPDGLNEADVEKCFYHASLQTETFGDIFEAPSVGERFLMSHYNQRKYSKFILAKKVYSNGITNYLTKKRSKTNEDDFLFEVMLNPTF